MTQTADRGPLEPLGVFVGEWSMVASLAPNPADAPRARTTFEWLPGRRFLVQRWNVDHPDAPDGIALIGRAAGKATFVQHYFDTRGVARVYEMTFDGATWTLQRQAAAPDFSQRFIGTFDDDRHTIVGRWETSSDGSAWSHDFDLTYTRLRQISVRPAQDGDRRALALLLAAVADERDGIAAEPPLDVDELARGWKIDGTLVAVADGEVVGEISVDPSWMGFGDIGMMVAADWRGRGAGKALVAAAIQWARARDDLHKLTLGVFPHNSAAIALYRKFGFVQEGRLVRHVRRADGQLWDLIEMGLQL